MGCTSSHEKDPSHREVYEKRRCGGDNDDFLTEHQKMLVRDTWSLLSDDLVSRGSMIFLYIFKKRPSAKELFPFRDVEGEALLRNAMFKGHGKRFMHAVETTVRNLDALDIILVPTLYQLGKRHAYITDLFIDYQAVFKDAIIDTFEQEMGPACTAEVRKAWTLLFEFIGNKLLEGYDVGMQERRLAESKEALAAAATQETEKIEVTDPACPANGNVTLTTGVAAATTCPVDRPSSIQLASELSGDHSTNPALCVERTTNDSSTAVHSDSSAPLATLEDEMATTPTSPKNVVTDSGDGGLVAASSMCPWAATDAVQVSSDPTSADVRRPTPPSTPSTLNCTAGTIDIPSTQTNDNTTTHSSNHQIAADHPNTMSTLTDNCNSSYIPATANSTAQSPQPPTDCRELKDRSNSVGTTFDNGTSSSEYPTTNDITISTVDHNSNGGLQCNVYSGCNGTSVVVDGNDVSRLVEANRV